MNLNEYIIDVVDFPKEGIIFKDITPIFENVESFDFVINELYNKFKDVDFNKVVAIDARGFIIGAALANKYKKGLVLARKPGKLPREHISEKYDLEYGSNEIQIHKDALNTNDNVIIIDDIIATGGTLKAVVNICNIANTNVVGIGVLGVIPGLGGEELLEGTRIESLIKL